MEEHSQGSGRVRRRAGLLGAATLAFCALALLFTQLLRPLVEPRAARADVARPLPPAPLRQPAAAVAPVQATPVAPEFEGPRIAIILTEVGEDQQQAYAAIAALPSPIGLAFSPYADGWAISAAARGQGHEVWAGVPMQPKAYPKVTPGPNTLLVASSADENLQRLEWALKRVEGPAGITGIMGSAFTENEAAMRPIFAALKSKGLAFLDSRASAASDAEAVGQQVGVPVAVNDRFLDESGSIDANLAALEAVARKRGSAVGFARALPATVEALAAWADTLGEKGILLVPPSSLTR